ncbi:hypothetical protein GCM10010145_48000 [Streptomyces ruber]|uniref:Uncharacterized protein n=2 Tax=Streptomyces TaxID=1883 RepID=A0A918EV46_9ACTN|nr:hypothetical protein GCM10010145_48000 [Streptomyces ruber]
MPPGCAGYLSPAARPPGRPAARPPGRPARAPSKVLAWTEAGYVLTVPAGQLDLGKFTERVHHPARLVPQTSTATITGPTAEQSASRLAVRGRNRT